MSPILIAMLGVLVLPLFIATWRTSLLGLACQGFLMAWLSYRMTPPHAATDWLSLVDLALVRGIAAPAALYGVLQARNAPARSDVIPPNMLSWTLALGSVLVAFHFSEALVPEHGQARTLVAVASAGLMLGFLVLSTKSSPFSQMIGALRVENAIALFELGGARHGEAVGLRLGQIGVVVLTIALYRAHLRAADDTAGSTAEADATGRPTL